MSPAGCSERPCDHALVPREVERLEVAVRAMDVRRCQSPILVGHFEGDAIAGVEGIVDRDIVEGELSSRLSLGMYAGPLGTATVVLLPRNSQERLRRSHRGAVVAGLGTYDGTLSASMLTEAVRYAALRYLLQMRDDRVDDSPTGELSLSTLLLGYNSTATLTIARFADRLAARRRGRQSQVCRHAAEAGSASRSSKSSSSISTRRSLRPTS